MRTKVLAVLFLSAGIIVPLLLPANAFAASNASLHGPYSVLLTSAAGSMPENMVGLLTFDGVSNVTTSLQANLDGTLTSLTGTGTYSVTGSGAGSMTLLLSNNVTLGFDLAVQSGGKQVQLILSAESDQATVNELYGTAIYQSATQPYVFSDASLKGTYGLLMVKVPLDQNNGGPADILGDLVFDGLGHIKSSKGMTDFNGTVSSFTMTGTYSVNGDGTGSTSILLSDGTTINFALTLNTQGKSFQLIELTASNGGRNDVIGGSAGK